MSNQYIKKLYDLAKDNNEQGLSKFDEHKLRKALESNNSLMTRNKEKFKEEPKFHTCSLYDPCPICDKCRNKASHLYVRCQTCTIPICIHTHADRVKMIKRKNCKVKVTKEVFNKLKELSEEVL